MYSSRGKKRNGGLGSNRAVHSISLAAPEQSGFFGMTPEQKG